MKNSWGNWTLGKTLTAGFLAVAALVAVMGMISRQRMTHMEADLQEIYLLAQYEEHLAEIEITMLEQIRAEKDYLLSGDAQYIQLYDRYKDEIEELIAEELRAARALGNTGNAFVKFFSYTDEGSNVVQLVVPFEYEIDNEHRDWMPFAGLREAGLGIGGSLYPERTCLAVDRRLPRSRARRVPRCQDFPACPTQRASPLRGRRGLERIHS